MLPESFSIPQCARVKESKLAASPLSLLRTYELRLFIPSLPYFGADYKRCSKPKKILEPIGVLETMDLAELDLAYKGRKDL